MSCPKSDRNHSICSVSELSDIKHFWRLTHPLCEHYIVSRPFGPAGELAHVFGKNAGKLRHPFHEGLHSFRIRLRAVPHLTLLLSEALT